MVYKRYVKRGGKIFGPYYYESYRDKDGKTKSLYLPDYKDEEKNKKENSAVTWYSFDLKRYFLLFIIGVFVLASLFFYSNFTGRATLDIQERYKFGEMLGGKIVLKTKGGELIPADSKIIVSFGDVEKEVLLSEVVSEIEKVEGDFYVEGVSLSGNGEGYGVSGKRNVFPEVSFELEIFESAVTDVSVDEAEEVVEENAEVSSEEEEVESFSEGGDVDEEVVGDGVDENTGVVEAESSSGDSEDEETSSETEGSFSGDSDGFSESSGGEGGSNGESSGSGESSEGEGVEITGAVISESSNVVSGKVKKGEKFEYEINEGQDVKIVAGSVSVNGERVGDSEISLDVKKKKVVVSTNYKFEEEGFGEDYYGGQGVKISVPLDGFGIDAKSGGSLSVHLIYGDEGLVEAE